jgi:hypothetical protein
VKLSERSLDKVSVVNPNVAVIVIGTGRGGRQSAVDVRTKETAGFHNPLRSTNDTVLAPVATETFVLVSEPAPTAQLL